MGISEKPSWQKVEQYLVDNGGVDLRQTFATDPDRATRFSVQAADLFIDYSKNLIDEELFEALLNIARDAGVETARDDMFAGKKINNTEDRAALHVALRNKSGNHTTVDGEDIGAKVQAVLNHMEVFSHDVRNGGWTGFTGKPIKNVINIGIGGSELGPVMAT